MLMSGAFADEICGEYQRITTGAFTSLGRSCRDDPLPFGRRDYLRWVRRRAHEVIGRPPHPVPETCPIGRPRSQGGVSRLGPAPPRRPGRATTALSGSSPIVPPRMPGWRCTGRGTSPLGVRPLAAVLQPGGAGARIPMPSARAPRTRPEAAPAEAPRRTCPRGTCSARIRGCLEGHHSDGRWTVTKRSLPPPTDGAIRLGAVPALSSPWHDGSCLPTRPGLADLESRRRPLRRESGRRAMTLIPGGRLDNSSMIGIGCDDREGAQHKTVRIKMAVWIRSPRASSILVRSRT